MFQWTLSDETQKFQTLLRRPQRFHYPNQYPAALLWRAGSAKRVCRSHHYPYYPVVVTRSALAYNATRRYHITVSGDLVASVSTPTPRELYVEKIISQNRNSVNSITGPTTVYVGQTYQYTVNASTATGGYAQLEAFLDLSNIIFQVQSIATTYTAPPTGTNDKFYADACGWDNNPLRL